ncbi:MAG: hypothetical protein J5615_02845 [Fibrobacter sp.]|nr:hypothetical protein [Fibrobacter sp.]
MKKLVVYGAALAFVLWACDADSTMSLDQEELVSKVDTSSSEKVQSSSSQKAKSSSDKSTRLSSSSSKESSASSSSKEKSSSSKEKSSSSVKSTSSAAAVEKSSSSNKTKTSSSSKEDPVVEPIPPTPEPESSSNDVPVPPVLEPSSSSFSSSSDGVAESSSNVTAHQQATNIGSECMKSEGVKLDRLVISDDSSPSATYFMSASGEMKVVLENISLTCGAVVTDVSAFLSGDTLYAVPTYEESSLWADCICPTRISFELEKGTAYATAQYLTFDRNMTMALKSGTPLSEKERLKKTGFARGTCQKDETPVEETRSASVNKPKDLPVALLGFENGMYVMHISNVEDYCTIDTRVLQVRNGDTLVVKYEDMSTASRCLCTFDEHKFAVDAENADVEYFSFKSTLFRVERMVY